MTESDKDARGAPTLDSLLRDAWQRLCHPPVYGLVRQ